MRGSGSVADFDSGKVPILDDFLGIWSILHAKARLKTPRREFAGYA